MINVMLWNKAQIVEKLIRACLITCFKIWYVIGYVYEFMVNKGTYFFLTGWTLGRSLPLKKHVERPPGVRSFQENRTERLFVV